MLRRWDDFEFRSNQVVLKRPPTRCYLNLIETCNLRCVHCITEAPRRTADETGRQMGPAVLQRLIPHLGAMEYVGLTHAGEPITASILEPMLLALREARGEQATVVHVLSNGLALTPRRFEQLVALGVNSWSISIDGMSAESHDVVRLGSKIERLLPRVETLAQLKPKGVRLGVAWTLTRNNLAELPALIRFAAQAGLDWVKVEELVPVNPAAEKLLATDFESKLAEAEALADSLMLRFLNHTRTPEVWKCRTAETVQIARFAAGDDFANRMEINRCRLPFELINVEPDGIVKPIDFHHPPAGSLLQQTLEEIWNGPAFVMARSQSMARRFCRRGPITCPSDPGPELW